VQQSPTADRVAISDLSWTEYRDRIAAGAPVLLPLGSTEQHGPHLPLGTDAFIADQCCRRAAAELGGVTAPPVAFGYASLPRTGGGDMFPGSINLTGTTYIALVHDVLSELIRHGAKRLLAVNAHMENEWFAREGCRLAAQDVVARGGEAKILCFSVWDVRDVAAVERAHPEFSVLDRELSHASWTETSTALSLFPELVHTDAFPADETADFPPYDVFPQEFDRVPASGAQSPLNHATKEAGDTIVRENVAGIVAAARAEFGI
jgi:creatinine amidohydrolase